MKYRVVIPMIWWLPVIWNLQWHNITIKNIAGASGGGCFYCPRLLSVSAYMRYSDKPWMRLTSYEHSAQYFNTRYTSVWQSAFFSIKPRSHPARQRASTRVDARFDASNQTNVKDNVKDSHHSRRRALSNLRCNFQWAMSV